MKRPSAIVLIALAYSLFSTSESAARNKYITCTNLPISSMEQSQAGYESGSQQHLEPADQTTLIKQNPFANRHRKGFHVTPNLSWGISKLKLKSQYGLGSLRADKGQATQFGLDMTYMFGEHGGVGLGCRAESFGYHAAGYSGLDNNVTQSYFSVPFYARFITSKSRIKEPGFFTNIGFAYHALTSITDKDRAGGKHTSMEGYKNSVLSFQICAGLSIPVSRQVSIDAGVDYQYFLSNNFEDEFISSVKGYLHTFSGRVGVDIRLTK